MRAEHALALIREGAMPIAEVARMVGYASPGHLMRVMRAELGPHAGSLRAGTPKTGR
jgi:AraC-like DNA-binding protein